jgi:adenosylhomocysteine nucleosidase
LFALVASESREFSGLLRHVEGSTALDWGIDFARDGLLNGRAIVIAANGPGPKLAASAAKAIKGHYELEGLASIGFCGALSPDLHAGDVLVATSLVTVPHLGVAQALSLPYPHVAHALSVPRSHSCERLFRLLSIDQVAHTAESKHNLHHQTSAEAVEMETAGLAPLAQEWQIPFFAVKIVTDTASESFPLDFNLLRTPEGRFSRPKIIAATLRHPSAIPALINLNRRCTQAAAILGDFLANASF